MGEKSFVKYFRPMSRIGKKPIEIPGGVTVEVKDGELVVKGAKGELKQPLMPYITVQVEESQATVAVKDENDQEQRAMWGTTASLLKNMIAGVKDGFEKKLEINGVGYQFQASGKKLTIKAGYSHPVEMQLPEGIDASVEENVLTLSGIDKQAVGEFAANVRKVRLPEPYKGAGIKYADEQILRKAGKQAVGTEG